MTDVYLSGIGIALGDPVPVADQAEVRAAGAAALLEKEGLAYCRVSGRAAGELAVDAARATLGAPDSVVDAVVYATDTFDDESADKAVSRFLEAVGLSRTPTYGVALRGCANLGAALQSARCLVLAGQAGTVLVVTADVCRPGRRLMGANLSVLSDGAASCLVTDRVPAQTAFRLADVRSSVEAGMHAISITSQTMAVVKATADGVGRASRAVYDAAGFTSGDVARLVTHNYGSSSTRIFSAAARVPVDRIWCPTVAEVGHCFAADVLVNLDALVNGGHLPTDGRPLLALMTGTNVWSCAALYAA